MWDRDVQLWDCSEFKSVLPLRCWDGTLGGTRQTWSRWKLWKEAGGIFSDVELNYKVKQHSYFQTLWDRFQNISITETAVIPELPPPPHPTSVEMV